MHCRQASEEIKKELLPPPLRFTSIMSSFRFCAYLVDSLLLGGVQGAAPLGVPLRLRCALRSVQGEGRQWVAPQHALQHTASTSTCLGVLVSFCKPGVGCAPEHDLQHTASTAEARTLHV